jgi:4-carboxymuconolactone decarboxylase
MSDASELTVETPADDERRKRGMEWYEFINGHPSASPDTPYRDAGVIDFVFSEVWSRPGLDTRSRRWITLASVVAAGADVPLQAHLYSALKTGEVTLHEMQEFALQIAAYQGWPKGALVDRALREIWPRIESEGGVTPMTRPTSG